MVGLSSYYAPYDRYHEFDRSFSRNKVMNKVIERVAMKFLKSNQSRHYGVIAEGGMRRSGSFERI